MCSLDVARSMNNFPEIYAIANEVKSETEFTVYSPRRLQQNRVTGVPSVQAYYRTATGILLCNPIFQSQQNNWAMKELLQEFQQLSNESPSSSTDSSPSIVQNVLSSDSCSSISVDAEQQLQLQGEQHDIVETLVGKIFSPKLTSTARSVVGIIVSGLILVTQNAQYDGGGIFCALGTNVWSAGRDADTFRGGGCAKSLLEYTQVKAQEIDDIRGSVRTRAISE